MEATWLLTQSKPNGALITLGHLQIMYRNLHDGRTMSIGTSGYVTDTAALLAHMVQTGCGRSETVFLDGQLVAFLMAPAHGLQ